MNTCFVTGGSGFVGRNLITMLREKGYAVRALARSEKSAQLLKNLGASPVKGDLEDLTALLAGMQGCKVVFHLAASVDFWADEKSLWMDHVCGTENMLKAARGTTVEKFVYLSAASVIMNGKPIEQADESFQSDRIIDGYSRTKLAAEKLVLRANAPAMQTAAIRPPLIWGKGDTSALPQIKAAALNGQLAFINGGKHRFVTSHVKNVCHALILAAEQNVGGEVFFVTDGEHPVFKEFIRAVLTTQGIETPDRHVPLGVARFMARILALVWRVFRLKGHPPLYPGMVNTLGLPFIVSDAKARRQLGYQNVISLQEGLREMTLQPA
jgi:nucleoside-diphosphate-sugar epimerase